ncbi:hypothetical protein [Lutimaribacter saemankumensis]|uniref:hypothetical protein n=1 Tax=Lutimaribacter saemankumensis TaxID=490829 RepID=UPI001113EFF7|nr:hypothetical protein [Lutimaribacter saemankumensis]
MGPGETATRSFDDPSALGGQRDAKIDAIDGIAEADFVDNSLSLTTLLKAGYPSRMQSISTWTYDLDNGLNGVQGDLGVDLTDGGISDRFILRGEMLFGQRLTDNPFVRDVPFTFVARAYETNPLEALSGASSIDIPPVLQSNDPTQPFTLEVAFADLVGGVNVDLTDTSAVQATFSFAASNSSFRIYEFCTGNASGCVDSKYLPPSATVPLPASFVFLGSVLFGIGFVGRRKSRQTVPHG